MGKFPAKIKKAVLSYINEINSICPVDKAILYGSYAMGKAGAHSDIDLAIFSKAVDDSNRIKVMTQYLMRVTKYKLDLQPLVFKFEDYLSPDNEFIANEIKKKGVEIYSRV